MTVLPTSLLFLHVIFEPMVVIFMILFVMTPLRYMFNLMAGFFRKARRPGHI